MPRRRFWKQTVSPPSPHVRPAEQPSGAQLRHGAARARALTAPHDRAPHPLLTGSPGKLLKSKVAGGAVAALKALITSRTGKAMPTAKNNKPPAGEPEGSEGALLREARAAIAARPSTVCPPTPRALAMREEERWRDEGGEGGSAATVAGEPAAAAGTAAACQAAEGAAAAGPAAAPQRDIQCGGCQAAMEFWDIDYRYEEFEEDGIRDRQAFCLHCEARVEELESMDVPYGYLCEQNPTWM
jgi:hypothetical protein